MNSEIIITAITVIGLIFGKDAFWEWLRNRKLTSKDRLMLAIGRDRLLFLSKSYIKSGEIPADEYDMFVEMGESYLAMGGNHITKKRFNQARDLPVVDEEGGDPVGKAGALE